MISAIFSLVLHILQLLSLSLTLTIWCQLGDMGYILSLIPVKVSFSGSLIWKVDLDLNFCKVFVIMSFVKANTQRNWINWITDHGNFFNTLKYSKYQTTAVKDFPTCSVETNKSAHVSISFLTFGSCCAVLDLLTNGKYCLQR